MKKLYKPAEFKKIIEKILYLSFLLASVCSFSNRALCVSDIDSYEIEDVPIGTRSWKERERNQGSIGSCTAFAVAHCLEFKYRTEMSASGLYLLAKREWASEEVHGASTRDMMQFATTHGTYHETVVDDYNFIRHIEGEGMRLRAATDLSHLINRERLEMNSTIYRFESFRSLTTDPDTIKGELRRGKPVVLTDAHHAVACYGFRGEEFICKNSYGRDTLHYRIPFSGVRKAFSWE